MYSKDLEHGTQQKAKFTKLTLESYLSNQQTN